MQAHFSILSASIRPEIQEQIAIGLLLVGNNSVYFETSKIKLELSSKLFTPQAFRFLKDTLHQISRAANAENYKAEGRFEHLIDISKPFSFGYLEHLNKYSNNILIFSSPKTIELNADEALFQMLFRKYVDEHAFESRKPELNNFDAFKREFFPKVKTYFNVDQEITSKTIKGLIMPVKVDLIGRNEKTVYAQTIDMELISYHIQHDISVLLMLKQALRDAKGFLISSEPNKLKYPGQHEIWNSIRDWKDSDYVDLTETQKIEDYATQHDVIPFI